MQRLARRLQHGPARLGRVVGLVMLATGSLACAPYSALPLTVAPSARPVNAAGASFTGVYAWQDQDGQSSSNAGGPLGSGWVRFGQGQSQVELGVGPAGGHAAVRVDLQPPESGFTVALQPGAGVGYYRQATSQTGYSTSSSLLVFNPYLNLIFLFANRSVYLAPRLGWFIAASSSSSGSSGSSSSVTGWGLGGAAGVIIARSPFEWSIEGTYTHSRSWSDSGSSSSSSTQSIDLLTFGVAAQLIGP